MDLDDIEYYNELMKQEQENETRTKIADNETREKQKNIRKRINALRRIKSPCVRNKAASAIAAKKRKLKKLEKVNSPINTK